MRLPCARSARGRVCYGTGGGQACRSERRGRMRVFIGVARLLLLLLMLMLMLMQ
ncbi:hypothetical protein BLA6992_03056 [Burkholderia lata]|nr:hypothetical protein BLA6992_03056 [Burkholderia lata]